MEIVFLVIMVQFQEHVLNPTHPVIGVLLLVLVMVFLLFLDLNNYNSKENK